METVGFKLAQTGSFCPSFDPEIPDGVYILSFDILSLHFMTDGCVKKSSREWFFRGIVDFEICLKV